MGEVVLDASALLALLLAEKGAGVVVNRLPGAILSAVNYSETLTKAVDRGKPFDAAVADVTRLRLSIVPFDAEQAAVTTSLRPATRHFGLSFADRACLAIGLTRGCPVLTADRVWAELDIGVTVELIR